MIKRRRSSSWEMCFDDAMWRHTVDAPQISGWLLVGSNLKIGTEDGVNAAGANSGRRRNHLQIIRGQTQEKDLEQGLNSESTAHSKRNELRAAENSPLFERSSN